MRRQTTTIEGQRVGREAARVASKNQRTLQPLSNPAAGRGMCMRCLRTPRATIVRAGNACQRRCGTITF